MYTISIILLGSKASSGAVLLVGRSLLEAEAQSAPKRLIRQGPLCSKVTSGAKLYLGLGFFLIFSRGVRAKAKTKVRVV